MSKPSNMRGLTKDLRILSILTNCKSIITKIASKINIIMYYLLLNPCIDQNHSQSLSDLNWAKNKQIKKYYNTRTRNKQKFILEIAFGKLISNYNRC